MNDKQLKPLPLSAKTLERYKLRSRQRQKPGLLGGHLTRHKGQSLEFREFAPYTLGDDIRHIDWRNSARYGRSQDLLVRRFVAEEQLSLVISLDTRDTMALPALLPKIQMAAWLAEAIASISLHSHDRVMLHRLFGQTSNSMVEWRGASRGERIHAALRQLLRYQGQTDTVNLKVLHNYLPPTAIWLIITDLYFDLDEQAKLLARKIATAQDGLRWIILIDLDSWPHEKSLLGEGARLIEGPKLSASKTEFEISQEATQQIETNIKTHKAQFQKLIRRAGHDTVLWRWPASEIIQADQMFRSLFLADPILQRLFMRNL